MKINPKFFLAFFILLFYLSSCSSGGDSDSSGSSISVSGLIVDESDNPVAGAEVKSGSAVATTSSTGAFTLTNVTSQSRIVINVKANGYFEAFRALTPEGSGNQYINIMMESKGSPINFSSSSGGSLNNLGGSVSLAPNTVMDGAGNPYSGSVKAYIRFHNTSEANFSRLMQGGDFAGQNASGEDGVLTSFGFFSVEMEDTAGNPLNVKTGSTASFSQPIAPDQVASAPSTIKLWSFNKETGKWQEEGTAVKSGNKYVGQVGHFSAWNCDDWNATATIKGKVACDGAPQSNVMVTVINETNELVAYTDSNGNFRFVIPAGFPVVVNITGAAPINVSALNTGQIYSVGVVTPDDCTSGTGSLQEVLMSGTWVGNFCFVDSFIDSDVSYDVIFSENQILMSDGSQQGSYPEPGATYTLQGNQIVISYFDPLYSDDTHPNGLDCWEKWTVTSYTENEITLSPTKTDCLGSETLLCIPKLTKQ